ncbi:MAG: EamA family transporter [Desulfobacterium sp.]|nr:EamA family transporter [Desulfobacterium sp.]
MVSCSRSKIILSFSAIYFVWGSNYLAMRVAVDTTPPFLTMALRFFLASLLLALVAGPGRFKSLGVRQIRNALVVGMLLVGMGSGPIAWAMLQVPTGIAAMIAASVPVWFVLFEKLLKGDSGLRGLGWAGIFVSTAGVILLIGGNSANRFGAAPLVPLLTIVLACLLWAFGSIWGTVLDKPADNRVDVSIQMMGGALCNLVFSLPMGEWQNLSAMTVGVNFFMVLTYLVVFGSILVFLAFNFLIRNVGAGLVSTHSYVNPVVAVTLGWFFLGETVDALMVGASVMILAGVALIKLGSRTPGNIAVEQGAAALEKAPL